jgi:predicted flap endonuclease-1-like 5' DNA nuclease
VVDDETTIPLLPRGIGAPAARALAAAGFTRLDQLDGVPRAQLQALHGVGPKALTVLQTELERNGMSLDRGHD